jgi:centrin-3
MASNIQPHPSFPARPYSSTLHGKLPERNLNAPFGSSVHTVNRENARLERERQERERGAGPSNPVPTITITDEQREEINEAVRRCTALCVPENANNMVVFIV